MNGQPFDPKAKVEKLNEVHLGKLGRTKQSEGDDDRPCRNAPQDPAKGGGHFIMEGRGHGHGKKNGNGRKKNGKGGTFVHMIRAGKGGEKELRAGVGTASVAKKEPKDDRRTNRDRTGTLKNKPRRLSVSQKTRITVLIQNKKKKRCLLTKPRAGTDGVQKGEALKA